MADSEQIKEEKEKKSNVQELELMDCECCGGTFVKVTATEYKCDHCGNRKYFETKSSNEIVALLNQANNMRNRKEFDDAEDLFREIVAKDPKNPDGYWGLFLSEYGIEHVQDPASKRFLPTCNRGSIKPVAEDKNFQKTLELSNSEQKQDFIKKGQEIERIRAKVIELAQKEEPYDVFICYKRTDFVDGGRETYTADALTARDIYDTLSQTGFKVFFAEKTLQNLGGDQYEPIIYNALTTSKAMLVICSDVSYLNSTWVKNEWRRYIKQASYDESKRLIPILCRGMKAGQLPDLLKKYQALELDTNFKENLLESVGRIVGAKKRSGINRVDWGERKVTKQADKIKNQIEKRQIGGGDITKLDLSSENMITEGFKCIKEKMYKDAKEFFKDLKFNDETKAVADFGIDYIHFVNSHATTFGAKKKAMTDNLAEVITNSPKKIAHFILNTMHNEFYILISKARKYALAFELFEMLMAWDYEKNDDLMKVMISFVSDSTVSPDISAMAVESISKCYKSDDVTGYIETMSDFIFSSLKYSWFKNAEKYCEKIFEIDEGNTPIRWQYFLAGFNCNATKKGDTGAGNVYAIAKRLPALHSLKRFKETLEYSTPAQRKNYIHTMLEAISEAVTLYPSEIKHFEKLFDEIITFYTKNDQDDLQQSIDYMASSCQKVRLYNDAIKYYKLYMTEGGEPRYWRILQCKLKCRNDDELAYAKKPIGSCSEYKSAIASHNVPSNYMSIKKSQASIRKRQRAKGFGIFIGLFMLFAVALGLTGYGVYSYIDFSQPIVTFYDWQGNVLSEQNVGHGGSAVAPDAPEKPDDYYATNYVFVGWSANFDNVTHRVKAVAIYEGDIIFYPLTVTTTNGGSVNISRKKATYQEQITLEAYNDEFVVFAGWYNGEELVSSSNKYSFKMDHFELNLTAKFNIADASSYTTITSAQDLHNMTTDGKYILGGDIDMSTYGSSWDGYGTFKGTLFGAGHTIKNLSITSKNTHGLFNRLEGATISAINFENVQILKTTNSDESGLGVLCGKAFSSNLTNINIISGGVNTPYANYVGGISGTFEIPAGEGVTCTARGLTNNITIRGQHQVGGIFGGVYLYDDGAVMENIISTGEVAGKARVGGIFGEFRTETSTTTITMKNITKTGDVTATGSYCGGIGGYIRFEETNKQNIIDDIYVSANINGTETVGSIFGYIGEFSFENSTFDNTGSTVVSNSAVGEVGGLFGHVLISVEHNATVQNLVNNATVTAKNKAEAVGGVVGYLNVAYFSGNKTTVIKNNVNKASITALGGKNVGGVFGLITTNNEVEAENMTLDFSYNANYGNVTTDTGTNVAGVCGHIYWCTGNGSSNNNSNFGTITGMKCVDQIYALNTYYDFYSPLTSSNNTKNGNVIVNE